MRVRIIQNGKIVFELNMMTDLSISIDTVLIGKIVEHFMGYNTYDGCELVINK